MEQTSPPAPRPQPRPWRLIPLVALAAVGIWFLMRAPDSVDLELVLGERAQGLGSMEVAIELLPDDLLVRRTTLFFSEDHPAPPLVVVRARLQEGRRYRVALRLSGAAHQADDGSPALAREISYEGQASIRLRF